MKIIVDAYGGDHAPGQIVCGALDAMAEKKDLEIIFSGKSEEIRQIIDAYRPDKTNGSRIEFLDAADVITNEDNPTSAIKTKKDSSLVRALRQLHEREDIHGMVSAGSSGAVLTGAVLLIGRIEGISRPALAPILPNLKGTGTCLIDCGANADARPEYLAQFALMGDAYMRSVFSVQRPKVALLSNGVEDKKGNELTKAAFPLLKELPVDFVGNMEAREALSGDYDVIVADGFAGNILLKSIEGTATMVMKSLKRAIMGSTGAKIGSLFMKKAFRSLKNDMDYTAMGGAPFLGVKKIIIKSHGSSKANSIKASVLQACTMAEGKIVQRIAEGLRALNKA